MLVTRPQPGATETARRLAAMGYESVVAPVIEVTALPARLPRPEKLQAVLVTSGNALPALTGHTALPLLAVGDATAAKARAIGFTNVQSAGRDAEALAALVARNCDPAGLPLLVASQRGQARPLTRALRAAGFTVVHRHVYAVQPVTALPEPVRAAFTEGRLGAVLFFSPATARTFVTLAAGLPSAAFARVESLAISKTAAAALASLPWQRIRVASAPNQDQLLGLLS
ncbi:Uroporphyrinogen-III synthase [Rhodovastum atsumiense]|nr:Uroporphyrinogen-III synthase [Rhodovastum atsumiense]